MKFYKIYNLLNNPIAIRQMGINPHLIYSTSYIPTNFISVMFDKIVSPPAMDIIYLAVLILDSHG